MIFPSLAANLIWSIVVAGVRGALKGRNFIEHRTNGYGSYISMSLI